MDACFDLRHLLKEYDRSDDQMIQTLFNLSKQDVALCKFILFGINTMVNRNISRQELFEFARQVDQSRKKTPDYPLIDIICQEIHTFFKDSDPSKHQQFLNQITIFHRKDQTTLFPYVERSLPTPDFFHNQGITATAHATLIAHELETTLDHNIWAQDYLYQNLLLPTTLGTAISGGSGIGKGHVSRAFCNANHLRLTCINCNVSSFSAFQKTLISAAKQGDVIELDEFNAFPEDTQNHIMHLFEQFRTPRRFLF